MVVAPAGARPGLQVWSPVGPRGGGPRAPEGAEALVWLVLRPGAGLLVVCYGRVVPGHEAPWRAASAAAQPTGGGEREGGVRQVDLAAGPAYVQSTRSPRGMAATGWHLDHDDWAFGIVLVRTLGRVPLAEDPVLPLAERIVSSWQWLAPEVAHPA